MEEYTVHDAKITLAHGSGGKETRELIIDFFVKKFSKKKICNGIGLDEMLDSAIIPISDDLLIAVTSDSYTVNPIFFPGGDIGKLAACGTINDLAVIGARPIALMDCIVVEEGFPLRDLNKIINSFKNIVESLNISLLGGDFKVMPRGSVDKIIISTFGVGVVDRSNLLVPENVRPGDKIIVSGTIGDHGATILALQMGLEFDEKDLHSDVQPVLGVIEAARQVGEIHAAKDPTRGGLAAALNELAQASSTTFLIYENKIPVKDTVRNYSDMLGIDYLALACEGRAVLVVPPEVSEDVVEELRARGWKEAEIIGEVKRGKPGLVILKTISGGLRIVDMPTGELVPRIC